MTPAAAPVLGILSVEDFLGTYWQKEPLIVRGAFPRLKDPLSPDQLAGLACEDGVDSRLVIQRGGRKPWQVIQGPQKACYLRKLPRAHWTLLVQAVDHYSREVAAFAAAFEFLPRWRMDDVMVSLAPNHGTVGAHIDSYDVFLIQGQGRRRWEVDRLAKPEYKPGLDIRILRRFRPQDAWILEPGDLLYVPPGVGHRGVTLPSDADIALTYSVGFRAPSSADLLSALRLRMVRNETGGLFPDQGRRSVSDPGEISGRDLADLRRFLISEIGSQAGDPWAMAVGELLTSGGRDGAPTSNVVLKSVARRLAAGVCVSPAPGARLAWANLEGGRAALFVNGEGRVLPRAQAFAASVLSGRTSPSAARRLASDPALLSLVAGLLRAGVVEWVEVASRLDRPRPREGGRN
jgi:50S ribosomal protein L16 3-hydroxylase